MAWGRCLGSWGSSTSLPARTGRTSAARDRYAAESRRLLGVLEQRLAAGAWIMGADYTIADMAVFPWVRNLVGFYNAGLLVGFADFPQVQRALDAFVARPAVQRGLQVPA